MIMTFKHFLAENAHQGFDLIGKLKTVDDLINMVRFEPLIKAFQDGVAADKVYNVVLVQAKDSVNTLIQRAWEELSYSFKWFRWDHPAQQALRAADLDISTYVNGGDVRKANRTLEAAEKLLTDASVLADIAKLKRLAAAYIYCLDAFKAVQGKAIKGRQPKEHDPNEFHSRMGSAHSVATLRTALLKSITPPLDEFEAQLTRWLERTLKRLDDEIGSAAEIPAAMISPYDAMLFQATYSYKAKGWDKERVYHSLKREANADGYPSREAKKSRQAIEEGFLHKNALKLSLLLDKKGNLTALDVLPNQPVKMHDGAGTLTSEMKATFADGSQFTVRNKVIINTSPTGKSFYQYPTTFHDVKLPDGSKLEAPSEEKMVTVFGG